MENKFTVYLDRVDHPMFVEGPVSKKEAAECVSYLLDNMEEDEERFNITVQLVKEREPIAHEQLVLCQKCGKVIGSIVDGCLREEADYNTCDECGEEICYACSHTYNTKDGDFNGCEDCLRELLTDKVDVVSPELIAAIDQIQEMSVEELYHEATAVRDDEKMPDKTKKCLNNFIFRRIYLEGLSRKER